MFRRQFIQLVALSGAGALAPLQTLAAEQHETMVYQVKGFTCVTCAVGLDTLLRKEKGILSSDSTYPEGKVTVIFDPSRRNDASIRAFISDMGFTVASAHKG